MALPLVTSWGRGFPERESLARMASLPLPKMVSRAASPSAGFGMVFPASTAGG